MAPLVSIVMPCRNAGKMLRPAFESAIQQTYPDIEIIFVDDGSTDGSDIVAQEVAERSSRPIVVTAAPARGVNLARIHGLAQARGDYIQWLDADDELDIDKIALQVRALEADDTIDIAYGDWILRVMHPPGAEPRLETCDLAPIQDQLKRVLSLVWHPPNIYLLRRRAAQLLAQEQAWWPGRKAATDIEYFAVAALLGLRFVHVRGAVGYYNIWSAQQIGSSTPYSTRAATLKEIFTRLADLASRPDIQHRLSPLHWSLLQVDWGLWAVPPGSIVQQTRPNGGRTALANRQTLKFVELDQREVEAIRLIQLGGGIRFLGHHAAEVMARAPNAFTDQAEVIVLLEKLRRAGLLTLMSESVVATSRE